MKIVVAPQALKGSLEAAAVGTAVASGIRSVWSSAEVRTIPVADGGEGTVHALVSATGGRLVTSRVHGPLGDLVDAEWGILGEHATGAEATAVIEMAAASGLPLVPPSLRDPRLTSTYGTGDLIRAALDAGCRRLLIGIGGSATNDGGAGMARSLGAQFLDQDGRELPPGGAQLANLAHIDTSGMDSRLRQSVVLVACDVNNPLCGPTGASRIYGPQKGATPEVAQELDAALGHYAEVLERDLGADVAQVPGAGAAGGLGAGFLAFTGAKLVPGAELVLDALDFAAALSGADLVVTAEGRLDSQTAYGKAVAAVAAAAQRAGARVVALAGGIAAGDSELAQLGIDAALPIVDGPLSLEESMARAATLLEAAAARAMRLIEIGRSLRE
ncbi:MAG: glycerate kinase [Ktedonobacterales bacterium]